MTRPRAGSSRPFLEALSPGHFASGGVRDRDRATLGERCATAGRAERRLREAPGADDAELEPLHEELQTGWGDRPVEDISCIVNEDDQGRLHSHDDQDFDRWRRQRDAERQPIPSPPDSRRWDETSTSYTSVEDTDIGHASGEAPARPAEGGEAELEPGCEQRGYENPPFHPEISKEGDPEQDQGDMVPPTAVPSLDSAG